MRMTIAIALSFALAATAAPRRGPGYVKLEKVSTATPAGQVFQRPIYRVFPLADGSLFVNQPATGYEPNAIVGNIIEADGTVIPIRITEFLPGDKFTMAGTAGQVYSAALLDDKKTLAVGAGWVNASGRMLCGIVLLEKKHGDLVAKNTIMVRGSVRDVVAGPDNGIFAVTTNDWNEAGKEHLDVAFFGMDGQLRAWLGEAYRRNVPTDDAEAFAIGTHLQRTGEDSVGVVDTVFGSTNVYHVTKTGPCTARVTQRDDHHFLYPELTAEPCYASQETLGGGFVQPEAAEKMHNVRLLETHHYGTRGRGTVAVWSGSDDLGPWVLVATGHKTHWKVNANWLYVLGFGDGYIDALQQEPDGYYRVRVAIPGGLLTPSP